MSAVEYVDPELLVELVIALLAPTTVRRALIPRTVPGGAGDPASRFAEFITPDAGSRVPAPLTRAAGPPRQSSFGPPSVDQCRAILLEGDPSRVVGQSVTGRAACQWWRPG